MIYLPSVPAYNPRTALIVVDIQNDFAHPKGSLYVSGAEAVIDAANAAISDALSAGALVVYTQDWHPEHTPHFETEGGLWPVHCVGETWGAELHAELARDNGPVVRKGVDGADGYSGFTTRDPQSGEQHPTALAELLSKHGIERVITIGLATDYCVVETAADAIALGLEVVVPTAAVAAVDLEPGDGERALHRLEALGAIIDRES